MQTTERPSSGSARGPSNPMRGVILVAVAAVLGFFVLRAIDDTGAGPTADDVETADAAADTGSDDAPGTSESPETTAAPQPRPPDEVLVLVANASGVSGAAGAQSDAIQAGGYQVLPADNAPEPLEATQVMFVEGYKPDATALAEKIGAPADGVVPMPAPPPLELSGAHVLVLLGPDLAQPG